MQYAWAYGGLAGAMASGWLVTGNGLGEFFELIIMAVAGVTVGLIAAYFTRKK